MKYSWDKYNLDEFGRIFFESAVKLNSRKLKRQFKKSYDELEQKIEVVEDTTRYAISQGWKDQEYIWNLTGFILTISLDIKINMEQLAFSKGFGQKEFYIKNLCVIIFESLEDIGQILGVRFYETLRRLGISEETIRVLNLEKKQFSKFRNEHQTSLKEIRMVIGAHRDHDFILQLDTFKSLEYITFTSLVSKYDKMLDDLSQPLQRIVNESVQNFVKKQQKKK